MEKSELLENSQQRISDILKTKLVKAIAEISKKNQIRAFLIGGSVRDLLLNRSCKDLDFVVEGSGIDFAREVANMLGAKKVTYFKNFGTAMFKFNDMEVEFVGARKESYRRESRKPIVEDGTIKDDQERRDFTINTLALELSEQHFGDFVDPFDGLQHLKEKLLKTPLNPDITFSDDPLRMMRAIRFSSQLGFTIDPDSFEAIKRNADRIKIVSEERITTELNKIILSTTPSVGFNLLLQAGLLQHIFPEMVLLQGAETKKGRSHKDNFIHTLEVLDNVSKHTDSLWLRWAAILHDIAKPATKRFDHKVGWTFHGHEDRGARMVPEIFRRLKLPLDHKMKYVQKLVQLHLRPIALTKSVVTDSAIRRLLFDAGDDIEDLMKLCRADITSKNEAKVKKYLQNYEVVQQKLKDVEKKDHVRNWQPPITGEMIMEAFDIKPCKFVGDIKVALKDAILDGEIPNDLESATNFMHQLGEKLGLKKA
ncbi:MAG: poly(A) polymerase [Flavobacteriales bacterium]|jgi:poly(A) polymerase